MAQIMRDRLNRDVRGGGMVGRRSLVVVSGLLRVLLSLAVVLPFASSLAVFGQDGVADPTVYSTHRISVQRGHFDELVETVFIDARSSEARLAAGLYEGYMQGWVQAAREAREDLKLIRAKGRGQGAEGFSMIQDELRARQQLFATEVKGLEDRFFADLQLFLTPEQAGRWGEFEQGRRRSLFLRRYRRLAGEDVDLIKVLKGLEFALAEEVELAVEDLLQNYGSDLDLALLARQRMLGRVAKRLEEIRSGRSGQDGEAFYRSNVLPRHQALRELNDRYARELLALLPAAEAKAFQAEFDRVRYPRIFAVSQSDRYLRKLEELEDLTPKQESAISRLSASYELEVAPILERLMALQRERDEEVPSQYRLANLEGVEGPGRLEGADLELAASARGGSSARIADLERELWRQRRDIESRLIDSWFEVLTAAQRERAPKTPLVFQPGGRPTVPHDGGGG